MFDPIVQDGETHDARRRGAGTALRVGAAAAPGAFGAAGSAPRVSSRRLSGSNARAVAVPLARALARQREAAAVAWRALAISRLLVLAAALSGALWLHASGAGANPHDLPGLTHPFSAWPVGGPLNVAFSSLARWDAVWYLQIAHSGYTALVGGVGDQAAFFPLYPLLVHIAAGFSGSGAVALLAAYAISLAAFFGALIVLYRLVELELGRAYARPALLLLAFFPTSLFFGAPYTESLFLLLSIGSFYAGRTGRWAWAGALAALASATRPVGIALVVPLVLMYLYGPRSDRAPVASGGRLRPRYAVGRDLLWIALAPLGLMAFSAFLTGRYGDPLAFLHFQQARAHHFTIPFAGVFSGTVAAFDSVRYLVFDVHSAAHYGAMGARNLMLFGFLVFGVVATVGVFRRLPLAYGAYVLANLALPLTFPAHDIAPLDSLNRYLVVLFPIFMWLALAARRRGRLPIWLGSFAVLLAVFSGMFAAWQWVA